MLIWNYLEYKNGDEGRVDPIVIYDGISLPPDDLVEEFMQGGLAPVQALRLLPVRELILAANEP